MYKKSPDCLITVWRLSKVYNLYIVSMIKIQIYNHSQKSPTLIKKPHEITHKIGTQRQRNPSQSPHRNNTRYPDSQNKCRWNTPKHQRQISQVQTTEETYSEQPGIDNTESTELQLNHNNWESTDSENDTENTILVHMIEDETAMYEQLFHLHVYENQLELLLNYYTRPRSNKIPIEQEANEEMRWHEPEKEQVPCSSTNQFDQNIEKEPPKETNWTISFTLRKNKK